MLANRAFAYKKLKKFQLMYDDSQAMIEVDQDNFKGYLRNGEACIELCKSASHKDMSLFEKGLKRLQKAISLVERSKEFKDAEQRKKFVTQIEN